MKVSSWTEEVLYTSGDEYFAGLIVALKSARLSIELESYIYEKGVLGERITEQLIAAAQRGVRVRMIIDGWGSPGFVWDYWPRLKQAGVRVRFFRASPWLLKRLPGDSANPLYRWIRRWRTVNRGNHRKFCLLDHTDLWVGSFNVSDVHLKEIQGARVWKDVGVRVCGPEVRHAKRAFQRAYRGWTAINWPARSPRLLLLNDSILHKRRTRLEQLSRLRKARTRIWLATPYFVPVGKLFRTLGRQARRGVDVRLTVPLKNDVWFIKWLSLPLLRSLTKKGVKVFVYSPIFSHQKLLIADDWMCIGSTNLNHRSFLHDLEMDVVITHANNRQCLLDAYIKDLGLSRPFDSSEWANLAWWKRVLSSVFLLAKYWS